MKVKLNDDRETFVDTDKIAMVQTGAQTELILHFWQSAVWIYYETKEKRNADYDLLFSAE